jgi:hypothetical protein
MTVPRFDAFPNMSCRHATQPPHVHVGFVLDAYLNCRNVQLAQSSILYLIRLADKNLSFRSKVHCVDRGYSVDGGTACVALGYLTPWGPQV